MGGGALLLLSTVEVLANRVNALLCIGIGHV